MRHDRALTLVEIVVCVAIVAVLLAVVTPVLVRAKRAGDEAHSKSNLRQIYLGLEMYREQNDKKVEYGSAVDMGLPETFMVQDVIHQIVPERKVWRSRCCCHRDAPTGAPDYKKYRSDYAEWIHTEAIWRMYVKKHQGDSIYVADFHCNDRSLALYFPMTEPVKGLGVRLNGSLETRQRPVSISSVQEYWNDDRGPYTE
jgi:prepilin-type N-terminal cleavage/methylation domain-containing protein